MASWNQGTMGFRTLGLFIGLGLSIALIVACGGEVSTPIPTPTPTPPTVPTRAPTPTTTPRLTGTPTATPTQEPPTQSQELLLELLAPQENIVVHSSRLAVRGFTSPDATVSVNGQLATPRTNGYFEVSLLLKEGPNLIEVIASDLGGNQEYVVITVIYLLESLRP